jgi:hypothetical protein
MWNKFKNAVTVFISKFKWTTKRVLTQADTDTIRGMLTPNYFIILTRHHGFLSSYAIAFAHFFLTGKCGYYSHVLMNLEDEVKSDSDFRLIEATGAGIHYSSFQNVFDPQCGAVALLKPKSMSIEYWTEVMDRAKTELGKPYDTLFDLTNDRALSCVELVRDALRGEPNYETDFADFERMISKSKNLDPHMFYECKDFEVVYEVRH